MADFITTLEDKSGNNLLPRTKIKAISDDDGNYFDSRLNASDFNALMSKSVRNRHRSESHINEQRNVTVAEVMNTDPFDPCGFRASIHFGVKI